MTTLTTSDDQGVCGPRGWIPLLGACVLVASLTLGVFVRVVGHDIVYWDDPHYVTENAKVSEGLTPAGIVWAFTTFTCSNWHPLTWISHMLDVSLLGMNVGRHHLVNAVLHVLNSLLLLILLHRMTGRLVPSVLASVLFGVHPLHVESVAWLSERKDVLSTFFWFSSTWVYVQYARSSEGWQRVAALGLFLLALLAKPMAVTLPFTLLLLDVWPLRRLPLDRGWPRFITSLLPLLKEKVPFFLLTVAHCVVTAMAQRSTMASLTSYSIWLRFGNAVTSYVAYLVKTVCPVGLSCFYPMRAEFPAWEVVAAVSLLIFTTFLVLRYLGSRPHLAFGWFWYVGTLVPAIGIVHVGAQAMADRYTYVPLVGIFVAMAWLWDSWRSRGFAHNVVAVGLAAGVVLASSVASFRQTGLWRDSVTLFEHALHVTRPNPTVHHCLGIAYFRARRHDEAIQQLRLALRLFPGFHDARFQLGKILYWKRDIDGAGEQFSAILHPSKEAAYCHYHVGNALMERGDLERALFHYRRALFFGPETSKHHNKIGSVLLELDRPGTAEAEFSAAVRLNPQNAEAASNLVRTRAVIEQLSLEVTECAAAVRSRPDDLARRVRLGMLYQKAGKTADAIETFVAILDTKPEHPEAGLGLATIHASRGEYGEAIAVLERIARTHHELDEPVLLLAGIHASIGDAEGIKHWLAVAESRGFDVLSRLRSVANAVRLEDCETVNRLVLRLSSRQSPQLHSAPNADGTG